MSEQWTRWEPIPGLAKNYYIDAVLDTPDDFTVILSEFKNENNKVRVVFKDFVDSYRCADETYRVNLFSDLDKKYPNFCGYWTFFKVVDSDYLQWLSEQSYTISDYRELQHFSFLSANSILDVISPLEPKVELLVPNQEKVDSHKDTQFWASVEAVIKELVDDNELKELTNRENVVRRIVKRLTDEKLLNK